MNGTARLHAGRPVFGLLAACTRAPRLARFLALACTLSLFTLPARPAEPGAHAQAAPRATPPAASAAATAPVQHLVLGIFPYLEAGLLKRRLQPLADYFTERLPGVVVELRVLPRDELQNAIAANQLDLVLTNPSQYLELRSRNTLTGALATLVRQQGDLSTSSAGGAIVVRADSPVQALGDLRGRRIVAPRGRGLAAYQAQAFELQQAGVEVGSDATLELTNGQHEAVRAVVEGRADVAFVRAGFLEDREAMAGLDPQGLRVVHPQRLSGFPYQVSTRLYPEWPLLALPHVDHALVRRVAAAALSLPADHPAARAAGIAGFDPPADYLPVERLARALRAAPYDQVPTVRLRDLIEQHRDFVLLAAASLLLVVTLMVQLARRNRQLRREQSATLAARNRLQATLDALPDLLFELDQDGRYLFAHSPRAGLLAAPLDHLTGRLIDDVLPAEVVATCRELMADARAIGVSRVRRYRLDLPDGPRWFEATMARKPDEDDSRPHYVMIARDITERTLAETELERHRSHLQDLVAERTRELSTARDAAEQASRAKSDFLANMSHEIRTPLNAVIGMGHLLRRSPLNTQQASWLDALQGAGEHLLEVLNAILDLSKIEAGKFTLDPVRTDLRALVANARSMVAQRAADKGLDLSMELPGQLPAVQADATRVQQALLNLLHNAIKFTERGQVRLVLRVEAETDTELALRFEVHDTGIGVSADALPRLFGAFEQADNSTSRSFGGTGLGLAITQRLARLMGGDAGAASTPGQGSTFWFTARLPRSADDASANARPGPGNAMEARLRAERSGRRVLLVEDDPINREVARELLTQAGQTVLTAEDGEQALRLMAQGPVDLVLMDVQMPRLDGLGATMRIRSLPHGERVPVVALTANAFADDRTRCLAAGMNDFLAKPLDVAELHAALWRWLP